MQSPHFFFKVISDPSELWPPTSLAWGRLVGLWYPKNTSITLRGDGWHCQWQMKCAIYICKGSQRSGGSRTKSKHRRLLHKSSDCLLAVCITCRFYNNKNKGNWIFKKKKHLRDYAMTKKIFLAQMREAIFDLAVKWRLILARIFLLDTFWVSALLIFSNEKKRGVLPTRAPYEILYLPLVGSFACFLFPFSTGRKGS